ACPTCTPARWRGALRAIPPPPPLWRVPMTALLPLADLPDPLRELLEVWLVEFDQSWDEGRLAARARQIPPDHPLRLPALAEMVKIDQENHWRRGRPVPLESYLHDYPALGTPATVAADLILAE